LSSTSIAALTLAVHMFLQQLIIIIIIELIISNYYYYNINKTDHFLTSELLDWNQKIKIIRTFMRLRCFHLYQSTEDWI